MDINKSCDYWGSEGEWDNHSELCIRGRVEMTNRM